MSVHFARIRKRIPALIATIVTGVLLAVPSGPAVAGWQWESASCHTYQDGSGWCAGTFLGFRHAADSADFVEFTRDVYGEKYMEAHLQGTWYWCNVDGTNSSFVEIWDLVMQHRGYFSIYWDSNARCTYLSLINGSDVSNF